MKNSGQLPRQELLTYLSLWVASLIYATLRLVKTGQQLQEDSSPLSHVRDGWYRDESDIEWSAWKYFIKQSKLNSLLSDLWPLQLIS